MRWRTNIVRIEESIRNKDIRPHSDAVGIPTVPLIQSEARQLPPSIKIVSPRLLKKVA